MSHKCHYCDDQCACDGTREWQPRDRAPQCEGCQGENCGQYRAPVDPQYDPESDPDGEPLPGERD